MKHDVCTFVVEFDVYQHEGETVKVPGTLQPIILTPSIWKDISMDFIMGLPKFGNKSVIMAVVDRPSKYAHFSFSLKSFHHMHNGSIVHG